MTAKPDDGIDWSRATWKGSRLEQHREFHALPFVRKLALLEEMGEQTRQAIEARRKAGLSYIDPDTGEPVAGIRQPAVLAEDPPTPPPLAPPPTAN